mgnify:CR=1 FL=1
MASNMTFKTWDFKGVSKEDFEGDFEGSSRGYLRGPSKGTLKRTWIGTCFIL